MSQGWIETRIRACEEALEYLKRQILDLTQQVRAAAQAARTASSGGQTAGGGGGGVFFWSGVAIGGATGLPGAGTPGVGPTGQTVYVINAGAFVSADTNAAIFNGLVSPTVASQGCILMQVGGGYVVISQSCT
jgi:hypothetical protein